jgi:glutaminyl-tRNA synthetase
MSTAETPKPASNFIREIVDADLASGRRSAIITRFPPEPNGYLHIGHAKSICLNFGIARDYASLAPGSARTHLRLDDTNPTKEEQEYIDAIKTDVHWLGFDWGIHEYYASDYFDQLYEWARVLIRRGVAYVCDLSGEQISAMRGTPQIAATPSPFRDRPVEQSLDLFARMKTGEFPDGTRTLRAKIDLASPNFNMRDPVLYRIMHHEHPRTGATWCMYPMYDYAHGQSDWLEGITHSICTLEFEDHRPLYDWFIRQLQLAGVDPHGATSRKDLLTGGQLPASRCPIGNAPPQQIEFARLNLSYTLMSKRKLLQMVEQKIVAGWDDPRMPTISGIRRRGYTPRAMREFCEAIGVAKRENTIELSRLEHHIREDLNKIALRRLAVLRPLKLVVTNYPQGQTEEMEVNNNPEDPAAGARKVPFTRELYIEREDFMEVPAKGYFRLSPGTEVRLRAAYWVRCTGVVKDAAGNVAEVHATYDPATRGGSNPPDGRKVKATIHWVSATHAVDAEVRLYNVLFTVENPETGDGWLSNLNPHSLEVITAKVEPSLAAAQPGDRYQFERLAYFCCDPDTRPGRPVFNRTVTLKDSWAKEQKKA